MLHQHPKFSVVVPTYNRAATLTATLKSVAEQRVANWELIVVDDGSTDHTKEVVQEFSSSANVRYFLKENGGVSSARNYGASHASGQYLVFLDSDDQVSPDWLSNFDRLVTEGAADVAFCAARFIYPDGKKTVKLPKKMGPLFGNVTGIFNAGTYCVRRSLFLKAGGFDTRLAFGENYELGMRLLNEKQTTIYTNEVLMDYAKVIKRAKGDLDQRIASKEILIQKYRDGKILGVKKTRIFVFQTLQSLAVDLFQYGNMVAGRKKLLQALKLNPLRPVSYLRLILSQLGFYRQKENTYGS